MSLPFSPCVFVFCHLEEACSNDTRVYTQPGAVVAENKTSLPRYECNQVREALFNILASLAITFLNDFV